MGSFTGTPGTSSAAVPASLNKATIKSESGTSVSLMNGFMQLQYYESLLQDSIYLDFMYVDTGNTLNGMSLLDGLQEQNESAVSSDFTIEFEDNNNVALKLDFKVNKVSPIELDDGKEVTVFNLITREYLMNEWIQLTKRFNGKISDHIRTILEDKLFTQRKIVEIEDTQNRYNFIGQNKKVYYTMNWLSTKAIPEGGDGDSAGFLLYETSKGYYFKSIDSLFKQKQKKSFIYTGSTDAKGDIPPPYDGKILEHVPDNRVNLKEKLKIGMYGTKIIRFDPFNCYYEEEERTAEGSKPKITTAGKDLAKIDSEISNKITRTTYCLVDRGVLPDGDTSEQIELNEKETLDQLNVTNQAIRRYNQMYSAKETITISGDFSLHAGDVIWIDFPMNEKDHCGHEMKIEYGGKFVISELCHYMTSKSTFTKMNVIRDSFGREGKPTGLFSEAPSGWERGWGIDYGGSESSAGTFGTEDYQGITVPRSRGGNFL